MNIKYAAVPIIALTLMGCNLEKIANPDAKSEFQKHSERIAALEANYAKARAQTPPVTPVGPATIADGVDPPIPVYTPPPQPTCIKTFRVNSCDENGNEIPWSP